MIKIKKFKNNEQQLIQNHFIPFYLNFKPTTHIDKKEESCSEEESLNVWELIQAFEQNSLTEFSQSNLKNEGKINVLKCLNLC